MKYKMVATDFDGTLYPPSKLISEYTKDVINRYIAAGGVFVICSGRMYCSIADEAKKLGLHGEAITYQGSLTRNIDTGETLDMAVIPHDLAVEYLNFVKKFRVVPQMYVDDTLCVEKENPYTKAYAEYCGVTPHYVGDFEKFIRSSGKPINKVYCHVSKEDCPVVRAAAEKEFAGRLMISSSGPHNVEAVDISASKGKAVRNLAKLKGIDIADVMTFGDNLNDLDMIVNAGFGVAVANAVQAVKDKADYVSEDCADDGVAKTIEKFCL